MPVQNSQIADIFEKIADLLDLKAGNEFRIRSYRSAARTIRDLSRSVQEMVKSGEDLTELPYIGKGSAEKILQILETGTCEKLEKLRGDVPEELTGLMSIPRLGPRKVMELHRELGVETREDLKKAAREGRIKGLPGMGKKTERQILEGLERQEPMSGRITYKDAADHMHSLGKFLDGIDAVKRWEAAGSFRRRKETIGDLDILLQAGNREEAADRILEYGSIDRILSRGGERVTVRLESGLQVDFRFFEPQAFGSALQYFTGSKDHSVALRKRAQARGWKLNEYGLFKGDHLLAGKSEEAVYHRLNLPWIPPELREDRGEIAAGEEGRLPELIAEGDIEGELHCHTDATDGAATIREMAEAARDLGHEYLAITDHSKSVTMASGLDEKRLRKQVEQVRKLDGSTDGLVILAGIEVDILKSGELDLDEKLLAELDWVVASVHYNRNMSKQKMTERIVKALESGVVDCLGHPLGRIIGKREPMELDFDMILEACLENGVYLEINAQPDRLDLPDTYCKRAREAGVKFVITCDAHKKEDLKFMPFGVNVARRGWLEKGDVLNTCTPKRLRKALKIG